MSSSFFKKAEYHIRRILFDKFAIPKVRYEKISKVHIRKYLPSDASIIDCGAHDGSDTLELAKVFRNGKVYAFEPIAHLFEKLKANAATVGNITCFQLALSDSDGETSFYVSEGASDASSSLLQPKEHLVDHPDTYFSKSIQVKTLTLDSWAKKNKIDKIDLLWLDMQGFELQALKASPEILSSVSVIHTEVSTKETYIGVGQYSELRAFLELNGFSVKLEAIPSGWDMGNVLFVRNKA